MAATQIHIDAKYSFLQHLAGRTHYHRDGPGDGCVVVMVCGATLPLAVWEPLAQVLVDLGFQIVRYDLPGRGHTPLDGLGADFRSHIDQLRLLIEGLGIQRPVRLIGLASGALIVAAYAAGNRARVSHVGLIAPDGAVTHLTLAERLLSTPLGAALLRITNRRTLFARVPRYSSRLETQAFVGDLLSFNLHSSGFHDAVLETIRTFPLHDGHAHYQRLSQAGVPTCVIWGRDDDITPPEGAGIMSAMFGEASLHILENVGHLPFVEEPETVAKLLANHFGDEC